MCCTCVDEASRCAFAELFGFVGQRDFHHPWDVPGWSLHTDCMGSDQLFRKEKKRAETGGRQISVMKLHIFPRAGVVGLFSAPLRRFEPLSGYNKPENEVLER